MRINKRRQDSALLISLFVVVSGINMILLLNHELWEDEAQAWLIARDCTPFTVFNITSYEGHPFLWYYVLMPFAKHHFPAITLYLISYSVMEVTLFLVLFHSPFDVITKVVTALSPMFIYVYSAISRNYCLCALLIVLVALFHRQRNQKPFLYGVLLALLLQTHIVMAGMVFILCVVWLYESLTCKGSVNFHKESFALSIPFFSAVFLLFEFRNIFHARYNKSSAILAQSSHKLVLLAGICLLYVLALYLMIRVIKDKDVFKLILITTFSLFYQLMIYLFVYSYNISRLILSMFILLFFCWNCHSEWKKQIKRSVNASFVVLVLCFSAVSANPVYIKAVKDLTLPYTDAKNTAKYINENIDSSETIIINSTDACIGVVPYLTEATLFDPFTRQEISFINREDSEDNIKWLSKKEFLSISESECAGRDYVYMLFSSVSRVGNSDDIIGSAEILYDSTDQESILEETFIVMKYYFAREGS